jgi:hypothetical protein
MNILSVQRTCLLAERITYGPYQFRLTVQESWFIFKWQNKYCGIKTSIACTDHITWVNKNHFRIPAAIGKDLDSLLADALAEKKVLRVPIPAAILASSTPMPPLW